MQYSEERKQAIKQGIRKARQKKDIIWFLNKLENAEAIDALHGVVFSLYCVEDSKRHAQKKEQETV